MGISMRLQMQVTQSLLLVGGITKSIFPEAEALLLNKPKYQKALELIGAKKDMERYESFMDFLFCELHPQWKSDCRKFYEGEGPMLKDMLSVRQHKWYSLTLLMALEVAIGILKEKRLLSWGWYRSEVLKRAYQAAA